MLGALLKVPIRRVPLPIWVPVEGTLYPFPAGKSFYHGTPFPRFRVFKNPAFLTPYPRVAAAFAHTQARLKKDAKRQHPPRRLRYTFRRLPMLLDFLTSERKDSKALVDRLLKLPEGTNNVRRARALCKSNLPIDGWIASYPPEVLLCNPSKFLEYKGTREAPFYPLRPPLWKTPLVKLRPPSRSPFR